jgi:hypothetical protein
LFFPLLSCRSVLEDVSLESGAIEDVTEADAEVEGAEIAPSGCPDARQASYRGVFAFMWNQANSASGSWRANPFVWSLSFKLLLASA